MDTSTKRVVAGAMIAIAGILGLGWAAAAGQGHGYALGLLVFVAAILSVFRLIRAHFDDPAGQRTTLMPRLDDVVPTNDIQRWLAGALAAVIALIALFVASGHEGGSVGHDLGIAGFVLAVLYVFLLIKRGFDRRT